MPEKGTSQLTQWWNTPERRSKELAMMQDPDRWPKWPHLPMKKYSTTPGAFPEKFGYLIDVDTDASTAGGSVKPILYTYPGEPVPVGTVIEQFKTFEELLDAGWVVD